MTDQVRALVVDVQRFSVHDGPGIRTTVFFKGCPLRCAWCQNPESLRPEPEPNVGRWVTVDELLEEVRRDGTFYGADGGVTLSGGEPTLQHEFLRLFVPRCVKAGLSVGLQTCGAYSHSALESLLGDLGFVYFDLKLMDRAAHKQHTSADNRTILANARRLVADGTTVLFRIPLIPSSVCSGGTGTSTAVVDRSRRCRGGAGPFGSTRPATARSSRWRARSRRTSGYRFARSGRSRR